MEHRRLIHECLRIGAEDYNLTWHIAHGDGLNIPKTEKYFVLEVSAPEKEIDELIKKLQPLGLASASRTGVVAMTKGAEVFKQQ